MPNTKPVGVAFSDPELVSGTTITGAAISGGTITGAAISLPSVLMLPSLLRLGLPAPTRRL